MKTITKRIGIFLFVLTLVLGVSINNKNVFAITKDKEAKTCKIADAGSTKKEDTKKKNKATQTEVEVIIKYCLEDKTVLKEEKIKAEVGAVLDNGDLPMLDKEYEYVDDFLFYKVLDKDNVIERKVAKIKKETKKENKATQTDLTQDDITKLETKIEEYTKKIKELEKGIKSSSSSNEVYKNTINKLEKQVSELKDKLNKNASYKTQNAKLLNKIESLTRKVNELSVELKNSKSKGSGTTKTQNSEKEEEIQIRYPNKLSGKGNVKNSNNNSNSNNQEQVYKNKGVRTSPSKARGTVISNVDNANNDYPIHHGDEKEIKDYSADARQFVSFTTKTGKEFHLIINHDEKKDNVMLLTEVSEDDLLNMVDKKETKKEVTKDDTTKDTPTKETTKDVVKEEKKEGSGSMMYIIMGLGVLLVAVGGYYFKVMKKKENAILEEFDDEDDDFIAGSEECEYTETQENEDEEV